MQQNQENLPSSPGSLRFATEPEQSEQYTINPEALKLVSEKAGNEISLREALWFIDLNFSDLSPVLKLEMLNQLVLVEAILNQPTGRLDTSTLDKSSEEYRSISS